MANDEIILRIKTMMDSGDVKGAVSQMQSYFDKLKPSDQVRGDFDKLFKDLIKEADQFETRVQGSFDKIGDVNSLKKVGNNISTIFSKIIKEFNKISGADTDLSQFFDIDTSKVTQITKQIDQLKNKLSSVTATKIDDVEQSFNELLKTSKRAQGSNFFASFKSGDLDQASADFEQLSRHLTGFGTKSDEAKQAIRTFLSLLNSGEISSAKANITELMQFGGAAGADSKLIKYANALVDIAEKLQQAKQESGDLTNKLEQLDVQKIEMIANAMQEAATKTGQFKSALNTAEQGFDKVKNSANQAAASVQSFQSEVQELGNRASYFLSLENSVDLFRRGVQQAIETVKELDAVMTETAVVTDFTVGDMWDKLPEYSQMARELGVEIKGVYEASTLYYQQGLQTEQVMALTTETLKMARIAGLECADATNLMTAALRGFNMEIDEQSAQRVNDIYSELAAITAADTNEIATAMTKTASIASSANMELETTAALLAQMIETTREPAETAGTAMKTIVARFTEMKKATSDIVSVDGEEISVNKVEDALRSAGVALRDANGEFRDLDDVLLELASKWNNLDIMTQRYVATTAAGSRQQSRFIAMMQNYDRTMELVDAAYNSSGASATQFNKTQESLQSILARLSVAWDTFLMGIADDKIIKTFVKILTKLLETFNKITEGADGLGGSIGRIIAVFGGLRIANAGIKGLMKYFVGLKGEIAGTATKLTLLQSLTQRINNFKIGNGFRTNIKVETGEAHGKLAALKADIKSLYASIVQPVIPAGTITGFQILDGKIIATAVNAEGATETIEVGMSQVALKAFGAAMAADEVGDEIAESGISGKMALDILQKEYDELIARQLIAKKLGNNKRADNLGNQADDVSRLRDMLRNGQNKKPTNFWNAMKNGATKFVGKLIPLAPMIAALTVEVGLLAAAWYFSPEQTLKRQIEDATNAAKSANEVFDNVNASLNELTNYRTDLETIQDGFDGLAEGTSEWRTQLAKANSLVLEIIRKYPELAQYQIYGKNGQLDLTEEGWEKVIQKQQESAAIASTTNTIASARVDQLSSELQMYQDLETKQSELAGNWDEGLGTTTGVVLGGLGAWGGAVAAGSIVSSIGAAALGGSFGGGALAGAIAGATAGTVVPVVGNIIGAVAGLIAGAAIGYGVYKGVQNTQEDSEEYKQYKEELEEKQKIERENRLQQYSAAMYNQFSADEEMGEDKNLAAATELMAEKLESNIASASSEMGLDDWTTDGANEEEIKEWAENLGYRAEGDKVYDQSGELVFKIEKSGDSHEGEEGWITNEQIAQQLAVQRATNTTKEQTEELLKVMDKVEGALKLDKGSFSDLLFEEDLSGTSVRKLMNMDMSKIGSQLDEMSAITGQNMRALMQDKIAEATKFYKQMNEEMLAHSNIFSSADEQLTLSQFEEWIDGLTDKQYSIVLDTYQSMKETMGSVAGGFYINALKENAKDFNKILYRFENVDFSNPISAFADLTRASKEAKGAVKETADGLLAIGETTSLSKSKQWKYFFNSAEFEEIRKSLDEIKAKGQRITSENIYEMAESSELLRDMLNSGAAGAQSLLVAIEGLNNGLISSSDLTENFVEALGDLYALADLTAKSFNTIDNLNISRSSTEISKFWSDSKKEMLELYNMGAYGDQRLIDYMVSILGQDGWNKVLKEAEARGGGYKEAMSKYMTQIADDSFSMYSDWVAAANKLDYVTKDGSGAILFDFRALGDEITNTDELIAHMAETLGRSEAYVEAMITDMSTFSSDFRKAYDEFSGNKGLETLLTGAGTYSFDSDKDGTKEAYLNISREQLSYFIDEEEIDAFVEKWNSLGNTKIDLEAELVLEDGTFSERLYSLMEQDIAILATIDIDAETEALDALYTLTKDANGNIVKIDFETPEKLFWAVKELYQANLDKGMLEDQAREAVEEAFLEKYEVTIDGQKLTEDVLGPVIDGVQNNAITLAAVEQAEIVGAVYGEAVFQAIIQAMSMALDGQYGYQDYKFTYEGKTYFTDEAPSTIKPTDQGGKAYISGVNTGNMWGGYHDLSKFTYDQKTGKYTYSEMVKGTTTQYMYIYDPAKDTFTYKSTSDGVKWVETSIYGDDVTADYTYPVVVVDESGQKKTINFKTGADFKNFVENEQSPDKKFKDENGNWVDFEYTPTQSANLKKQFMDQAGYSYDANGDIEAQWEEFKKTDKYKSMIASAYTDPDSRTPFDTGDGKDEDGDGIVDYEKESDRIKAKLDEIETAIKDLADNDITDMRLVNQLIDQKIALQKEYKKTLEEELVLMQQSIPEIWSRVQASGNSKYIQYNEETKLYEYTEAFESDFLENGVPVESKEMQEKMQEVQDQVNQLNKVGSDQLSNQIAIKELVDNLVRNSAEDYNAERSLKGRERRQTAADEEEALIGRLPEEIQGPLMMMNTAEDAFLEYSEIQSNKVLAENMQQELDATYAQIPDAIKEYITFDEYSGYGIDLGKIYTNIQDPEAQDDMIQRVQGNAQILNDKYDPLYDVLEQLDGGKVQKAIQGMAKASKTASRALKDQDKATDHLNDAFNELENKLGLNEDALDGFANALGDAIKSSEFLQGEFKGLGIKDIEEKINKSPIAGLLSDDQKSALTQIFGEGGQRGDILGSLFGGGSDFLNGLGDIATFDMMNIGMDMFDTAKGMIDQGKQMIEKIVGYIVKATQAIVDAWTNREDYLYNFLQIIEKHLNEYEKLQRYQNQLEKGRTSTVEEIRANYDAQWKSLQQQLEEQQERLETRQKELERSRWNPFSLISGWNPSSDALYENREVKFLWDLIIGLGEAFAPFGTGAFFSQLNQLYEDYDKRVQQSYEDRLAAEQALLDIEDERLELVKYGSDEATEFESKILEAMVRKEQEQIDELTRLNDAITDANSKLISTLQDNLEKMRQDRENEKKEEELSEKERRLAYLRQDTSGANMLEIKKLEEQLEEDHEDYTDALIDQKISELEKQNELAAEQRQQQIDLLQSQLDYAEKYGLYWDAIYGMLYTIDENGNAVLNPENFDLDGNIRENSELAQMLGTFSDRLGMSVWSAVLDNEEMKRLGRWYGFFIGNNGVAGKWRHQWALDDPGADDPNFAYPDQEIPEGLWGALYRLEIGIKKYFANSDPDLIDRGGRIGQAFKNFFGKLFGNEEWANYQYEAVNAAHVQSTTFAGMKKLSDDTKEWFKSLFSSNESYGNKTSRNLTGNGAQNIGDINTTNYFQIGKVGETISLDEMVDQVVEKFRDMFSIGNNILGRNRT